MKKMIMTLFLLCVALMTACGTTPAETTATTTEPTTAATEPATEIATEPTTEATVETPEDSDVTLYAEQIARYYTAISEQWDEGAYYENEMSAMVAWYYEGNALENVGYAFKDMDGDGNNELFIGAIANAQNDPLVFEIWTVVDGKPVMLAQSGSHNRYYTQYEAEVYNWSIAYEGENGAANWSVLYLQILDHELKVTQGIVFDAVADEANPWFLTYDMDWDVTNDEPTDEDMANAIIENGNKIYTALEYTPYSEFN